MKSWLSTHRTNGRGVEGDLVSTSGARFRHPDETAIARILQGGAEKVELCFNYRSETTRGWERRKLTKDLRARELVTHYPEDPAQGLRVVL